MKLTINMAKKGKLKNGSNKKLHTKLLNRKKSKEQEAKDIRKAKLKELNRLANEKKV